VTVSRPSTAALVVLALALGSTAARADGERQAKCQIRVIHAIDAAPAAPGAPQPELKMDPKLDKLRAYLLKPPFTSWHEFVLLEKKYVHLTAKAPEKFLLPNGKPASLTFVEHLPDEPGKPHRVRLQLTIGEPPHVALSTTFVIDEGGFVLTAGQHYEKGILVLGTSCETHH
jgi:hypothetical protein